MAFTYNQPMQRQPNVYEQAQSFTVGSQQQQQQQPRINPMQAYNAYQKLSGLATPNTAFTASPALLSTGTGTAAGLGGSGLIGSAGGATSAGATGGAGYGLGGTLVGGTGQIGGATYAAGAGTTAAGAGTAAGTGAAAGGGSAAGGGAASGAASSGPWGWLALAVIANETYQAGQGNRDQGTGKQIEHALTGKVVEDDVEGWGQMIDEDNKLGIKGDMQVAADISTGDFSNAFKGLEDTFGFKTLKGLF